MLTVKIQFFFLRKANNLNQRAKVHLPTKLS